MDQLYFNIIINRLKLIYRERAILWYINSWINYWDKINWDINNYLIIKMIRYNQTIKK